MNRYLSTTEAAELLGVSVATVKRWVDDQVIPAHRTPGGHRKILRAELDSLIGEQRVPSVQVASAAELTPEHLRKSLFQALRKGDPRQARELIGASYRAGMPIWKLADEVISPVMAQIGHQWETAEIDVYQEHHASQVCLHGLHQIRAHLDGLAPVGAPLAVGGCPEKDHYQLPSLLAEMVLLQAGWKTINLGPNTPVASFHRAIQEHQPRLIWISVSYLADAGSFLQEYAGLYERCEQAGIQVAVGGQALRDEVCRRMRYTTFGHGLRHLHDFARTLHTPARDHAGPATQLETTPEAPTS